MNKDFPSAILFTAALTLALCAPTPARGQCGPPAQTAKVIDFDAAGAESFGGSVAISGDTAVIGAPTDNQGGLTDAGSASVFVRSSGVWTQQAKLIAADGGFNDRFGVSVAIEGDTLVVGQNHWARSNDGSAYVFVRSGGVWTQQAKLLASDPSGTGDQFGSGVAIFGNKVLVGAYFADVAGMNSRGAAYVFGRSSGVWIEQAKLTASDGTPGNLFGSSVALSGDAAVVGSPHAFSGGSLGGAAYVFVRSGGDWIQQTRLSASDAAMNAEFGNAVAISGVTALVGAHHASIPYSGFAGSAYVFTRSAGVWTQQAKLLAADAAANDYFGSSVALSADRAVVGAAYNDHAGGLNAGAAYIFNLGCHPEPDSDSDGVPDVNDVCAGTPSGIRVDSTGRPRRDINGDCLVNDADIAEIVAQMLNQ